MLPSQSMKPLGMLLLSFVGQIKIVPKNTPTIVFISLVKLIPKKLLEMAIKYFKQLAKFS